MFGWRVEIIWPFREADQAYDYVAYANQGEGTGLKLYQLRRKGEGGQRKKEKKYWGGPSTDGTTWAPQGVPGNPLSI